MMSIKRLNVRTLDWVIGVQLDSAFSIRGEPVYDLRWIGSNGYRSACSDYSWAREAKEAERLDKMLKIENEENAAANNLALAIQSRNEARASQSDKFFDALIDKYAKMAEKPTRKKSSPARATKITKPTKKIKKKA